MSERIKVRKTRDGHLYPWAAWYPCCTFMNNPSRHGWPSWEGAMGQVADHLRNFHPRP